jgi:hypothetical protein
LANFGVIIFFFRLWNHDNRQNPKPIIHIPLTRSTITTFFCIPVMSYWVYYFIFFKICFWHFIWIHYRVNWPVTEHLSVCSGQAGSMGRAMLFLVFKQNLNPSYWHILHTNIRQKQNTIEKVMAPESRRGQELKKNKPLNTHKSRFLSTPKIPCMFFCCY